MARILIHVEGETEETFVNEVLAPHLLDFGHHASARLVGNARSRDRRGGIQGWPAVRKDLIKHLLSDSACTITTMVDYYGLPHSGSKAWPGRSEATLLAFEKRAPTVTRAIHADVMSSLNDDVDPNRFIPYVLMHEFEGLLFSDCGKFATGIGMPHLEKSFLEIVAVCGSPEEINDSFQTAPSKRIERLVPGYQKPLYGNVAILEIGLGPIRAKCPLFDSWVATLEAVA